ncbi:MAG: hypothetical protein O7C75_14950 [Verrucomicrobia bacterium]|nr:hypothetical protein [Verrucomicrobiota bacterium]
MIIIKFLEGNSHGQEYEATLMLDGSTEEEVEKILILAEEAIGDHHDAVWDHSKAPEGFGSAGGFTSDLLSAVDENGNDRVSWVSDWYGFPKEKGSAFL